MVFQVVLLIGEVRVGYWPDNFLYFEDEAVVRMKIVVWGSKFR